MDASPYLQLCGGLVWDFKHMTDADQVQRHAGDLIPFSLGPPETTISEEGEGFHCFMCNEMQKWANNGKEDLCNRTQASPIVCTLYTS